MKTTESKVLLREPSETLRAIAHPFRLAIIELLFKNKELSVTEIKDALGVDQPIASHHLRIMKNRNVVDLKRDGKMSKYFLTNPEYHDIVKVLLKVVR